MKAGKMLLFDEEKFMIGNEHSYYSLEYEVFNSDVDTTEMDTKQVHKICKKIRSKTGAACFAGFVNDHFIYTKEFGVRPNRIRLLCNVKKHTKNTTHLNNEEIKKWVEVCQENKIMPLNIGENFVKNGIYDINFENISMEMLYVYLCAGRYVQDEPFFIKGVLYLMDNHRMGFFTAFCLATYYQTTNAGHHLLPLSRNYAISQMPEILNKPKDNGFGNKFDLISAARLHSFVNGGDKGKCIKEFDGILPEFKLHSKITAYYDKDKPKCYLVSRQNLENKKLEKILKSGNFDKDLSAK